MLFRTHLIIGLFFILLFFSYIHNPFLFLPVSLLSTLIPDIDTKFSKIGKIKLFRIFNFFMKHRGIIHSFTFLFLVSFFILLFFKEILLPFVFGYSLHLILDSFTIKGIKPFYPVKKRIKGKIKTGGLIETSIFVIFLFVDLFIFLTKFSIL